ncbi:phosphoglucosamine mutase [Candidatus Competibacter phosphatis]|uniref:Phosphoglucosamine mutase n=1 Tax=Candidatus Competibacter phosphatis TaxID=221280 RepID=A0ABX1TFQ9_9GAMM|nr:phosphoglucosamine mutase [Candidatus Competibacter phosphatis]NMQ18202.1 phosphoglucosamine mutase [Candidatus Competibacter phosphatis]
MEKSYFGTDGIRGRVGEYPITAEFVLKLGWAVGRVLQTKGFNKVVVGKDTRISGYMFESALEAGLSAAGVNIALLGPMPTPGIAYLTRTLHACAGIVVSASHNPYYDNGIKFFSRDGQKLPDAVEERIEELLAQPLETAEPDALGKAERIVDAAGRYIEFCKSTIPAYTSLAGIRLVVDCAHGATYHIAPSVFEEMGATVIPLGVAPDGLNINLDCGSTKPAALCATVKEQGADLGIAFDGDGDRVIMVDHRGEILDGDELLFIIARDRLRIGARFNAVVGTLMTNLGLEVALRALGLELRRARVGDRYVMECLLAENLILGGESSGHIICLDRTTTGDGIISALQVLSAMLRSGKSLHDLKAGMSKCPQTLINVSVAGRVDLQRASIQEAVRAVENQLGDNGRVLLRSSGTEPVVRVMVEGMDAGIVERHARELADVVRDALSV